MTPDSTVFIHIGKTAGTSVKDLLRRNVPAEAVCPAEHMFQFLELTPEERERYRLYMGHLGWSQAVDLGTRLLTFLRNPYDRYLSLYYYWRWLDRSNPKYALQEGDRRREWGLDTAKKYELEEFVELDIPHVVVDTHNTQVWQLALDQSPQTRNRSGLSDEQVLRLAMEHVDALDVVGIVEDLAGSLMLIEQRFDWTLRQRRTPHHNRTPDRPAVHELPLALRRKIHRVVELDVELYHYALRRFFKEVRESGRVSVSAATG